MKPKIPITDARFIYVPAVKTDIRHTFAKARAEMKKPEAKTTPIRRKA